VNLLHVVPHIDREASGPGYSVPLLCDALGRRGHEVVLATLARGAGGRSGAFEHRAFPPSFGQSRLGVSRAMRLGLARAARAADVVHSHGLWMMPNIYPAWAAAAAGRPLVVSPRGTLSAVARARSRGRKALVWRMGQRRAVLQAACLHATSEQEYADIRACGLSAPVAVIPNGVDLPAARQARAPSDHRRLLYLGRIHPIKGLPDLLRAWAPLSARHPDWELRLVGPDCDGHLAQLHRLAQELKLQRIAFAPAAYGEAKTAEYHAADAYVLPSHSENFAMSVAEALGHGLPVVATTGTPWAALAAKKAGWWTPATAAGLEHALGELMSLQAGALERMGERGRAWMANDFSWAQVGAQMEGAYRWLRDGGEAPPWMRTV
jgi:glycosyltransferase involved in cell wall biosynthesis